VGWLPCGAIQRDVCTDSARGGGRPGVGGGGGCGWGGGGGGVADDWGGADLCAPSLVTRFAAANCPEGLVACSSMGCLHSYSTLQTSVEC